MHAPRISRCMNKRRAGSRQEVAAAAVSILLSSAHRNDRGRLQPKGVGALAAAAAGARATPDSHHLAGAPAGAKARSGVELTGTHLAAADAALEISVWPNAQGDVPPDVPGKAFGFCDFTKVKRVVITLRGESLPYLLFH
jgi:hypothetical protein